MIAPNEIPVGAATTFVGAPLFVYLCRRGEEGLMAIVSLRDVDFAYDERPVLRRIFVRPAGG